MNTIVEFERSLGNELLQEFRALQQFVADSVEQHVRIDQVERGLFELLLQLGFRLLQEFVVESGDGDQGEVLVRNDRTLHRIERGRKYRSIFGVLEIVRFVYAVGKRRKVEAAPLDERLGLPAGEQSYVLEDWTTRLASQMAYPKAVQWLREVLKIGTCVRAAETMVRKLSEHVEGFRADRPTVTEDEEEELLVVTVDGKGVPIRRPLEQRIQEELGKKPHKRQYTVKYEKAEKRRHRGDKKVRKQMATVGAVYGISRWERTVRDVLDANDGVSQPERPRPQNKRLWAEMTQVLEDQVSRGAERLFEQLAEEVSQRFLQQRRPVVCVMDGDPSLWKLKQTYLPHAVGILDIYHVMEKLWKAAYCFHPESSAEAEQFVSRYLKMLLQGNVGSVIGVFRRFLKRLSSKPTKKKDLRDVIRYFDTHREAMRYDEYLAAGYPIGSGVVEGACRHVVSDRLEQTGMRWEIEGAQAILNLRTTKLNGEWDHFIEYRIQAEQSALYSQAA
jgi:hypothetical protein